jgi:hypothetical protein
VISDPILSYPILSYPILSYPILSYPILSYPILSYPILSYPILSYPILSNPVMYCPHCCSPCHCRTLPPLQLHMPFEAALPPLDEACCGCFWLAGRHAMRHSMLGYRHQLLGCRPGRVSGSTWAQLADQCCCRWHRYSGPVLAAKLMGASSSRCTLFGTWPGPASVKFVDCCDKL